MMVTATTSTANVSELTPQSKSPLRLLIVASSAVPGGMEEIVFNLALSLPGAGVNTEVISLAPGPLVHRLETCGIAVRVLQAGRLRNVHRAIATSRALGRALAQGGFDAVFSNMPKAHLYTAIPARRHGVAALWCQAGLPEHPHWMDRLACALPADAVIALSRDAVKAQQRLNAGCPVHMLHPGVDLARYTVRSDTELRRAAGVPTDAPLISLVGRLQPWKGQREFLRAAALVARSHPTARFAIVGGAILGWEGDYPHELKRLAVSLGIDEQVIFTGHTEDVPRWLAASDIVVNASDPEPFGLVVIEAMAAGCAVVALATGGPRDIIEDGRTGVLCRGRSPEELAAPIDRLIENPMLRVGIGAAARERIARHFSRERTAESFARIVRRAVDSRASPRRSANIGPT